MSAIEKVSLNISKIEFIESSVLSRLCFSESFLDSSVTFTYNELQGLVLFLQEINLDLKSIEMDLMDS